jgi:hypothetical protein
MLAGRLPPCDVQLTMQSKHSALRVTDGELELI